MKLYLHHFDIYREIYELGKMKIISPYLCSDINNPEFIDRIRLGVEFQEPDCTNNLILKDKNLIEELSTEHCYLIFTATTKLYQERVPLFYKDDWDKELTLNELVFLGWDIYNNQDGAMIEGIYPIFLDVDSQDKRIYVHDEYDLNKFGLLSTEILRDKYLEKNKRDVKIIVDNEEVNTNWEAVAIYCDKYTFQKLNKNP